MIEIKPKRCDECIHLQARMEGDIKIFDYCYVYNCEITDELMDKCRFYCNKG